MTYSIEKLHDLIVRGQGTTARETLLEISASDIDRKELALFAQLSWRLNLPELGLRALGPIVRPPVRSKKTATALELTEYAHCLIKFGAVEEGEKLIGRVDEKKLPNTTLCRISAMVAQWRYAETIPILLAFLERKDIEPYQKVVAQANLAAAFVDERRSVEAAPLLRELLYTCSVRGFTLLLGRVMELTAENFVTLKKWDEADAFLAEARKRLSTAGNLDAFFVDKFRVITLFLRTGGSKEALAELHALKSEALVKKHWETARDCDRYEAIVKKNVELFLHVYFGTPFEHYRQRLMQDFGPVDSRLLARYEWRLAQADSAAPTLELSKGKLGKSATPLKPGSLLQRLMIELSSDFYRSHRLGTLLARLYPDRLYDPIHSPPLLYNAMHRLREWFETAKLPLRIDEKNGFFKLAADGAFTIQIAAGKAAGKRHGESLAKLRAQWPQEPFSIGEAQERTGLSRRTLFRLLEDALKEGVLDRKGQSKATRYAFRR